MPIYEYVCEKCGKLNDVLQKVSDPPPERCNGCGAKGKLTKIVSRSSFVLRGGGWGSAASTRHPKKATKTEKRKGKGPPPRQERSRLSKRGQTSDLDRAI